MKPKIIVANWKCNPESSQEAQKLFEISDKKNVVIAAPYLFLHLGKELAYAQLGAQDAFLDNGAFTGEVSCRQLVKAGVKNVILGHSERRAYFGETDELIVQKAKAALDFGLSVIICVGESQKEKSEGEGMAGRTIRRNVINALSGIPPKRAGKITVAYEPVWAIGTGETPNPIDVNERAKAIKSTAESLGLFGVSVLYGGSVDENNCPEFLNQPEIDGLLVGGASLVPEKISRIIKTMNNLNGDIYPVIHKESAVKQKPASISIKASKAAKKESKKPVRAKAAKKETKPRKETAKAKPKKKIERKAVKAAKPKKPKIKKPAKKSVVAKSFSVTRPKKSPFSKVKKSVKKKR